MLLLNAVVIFIMSGEDVDAASMEAICGDEDCVCEELFPQFTFACDDGEGYVPRHACDACKGYVWFDDRHGEVCSMSIEQYAAFKRQEEDDMLENLKHIWDDVSDDDVSQEGKDVETVEIKNKYDFRCLLDSDEEKEKNK